MRFVCEVPQIFVPVAEIYVYGTGMTEKLTGSAALLRQIRAEITRTGHTQKSFAATINMTPGQLGDYLRGRNQMGVDTLFRILDGLGVDYEEFWRGVRRLHSGQ